MTQSGGSQHVRKLEEQLVSLTQSAKRYICAFPANLNVISPAEISSHPMVFCPAQRGEKSPLPSFSASDLRGANAAAALGKSGTRKLIGPCSRMSRLTMPRAGRPENTLVISVWEACWD